MSVSTASGTARWAPRTSVRVREKLLTGPVVVVSGIGIAAITTYAFLTLVARYFGPTRYAPLAAFWSATFLLAPGVFAAVEKETTSRVSAANATNSGSRRVAKELVVLTFGVSGIVVLLGAATSVPLTNRVFAGNGSLTFWFLISVPSIAAQCLAWGLLAGNRRFGEYARVSAAEGIIRLAGGLCLLALGIQTVGLFAAVIALAPLASACTVARKLRDIRIDGPADGPGAIVRSLSYIVGASLAQSILINAGPIAVEALAGTSNRALTGRFLSGMILVRVPLFLYNAASATMLPALSEAAATSDWLRFRVTLRRLVALVSLFGLVTTAAAGTLGPWALRLGFGDAFDLPSLDLIRLASAASLLLLATTLSVGLTAIGKVRLLFLSWVSGVVSFFATVLLLPGLLGRVELGLVVGAAVATAPMAFTLARFRAMKHLPIGAEGSS